MEAIICPDNIGAVVKGLQEFLAGEGIIKSLYLVERDKQQVILLVDKEIIDKKIAQVWWNGYSRGMKAVL